MKKLRVMDSSGDSVVEFEPNTTAEQEARELFTRLTGKGAAVFAVSRGEAGDKRVKDFSELEAENVIVPAITGG